jgi:1-phosphofructokinase
VLPAAGHDPILAGLRAQHVEFHAVPVAQPVRTNLTITETDGTTTKINEPGSVLDATEAEALAWAVVQRSRPGHWVVLSGSLPPGLPDAWYSEMTAALRAHGCKVAVDTSDAPLAALAAGLQHAAPDLMKPNSEELAGLTGVTAESLETPLMSGDAGPVVAAARRLVGQGVGAVLATLGPAGAVLVDAEGAWLATPAPVAVLSTVGAGDSSLAGYIRAEAAGGSAPERLQMAVAYGTAAAALPGSTLPVPAQLNLDGVDITALADPL